MRPQGDRKTRASATMDHDQPRSTTTTIISHDQPNQLQSGERVPIKFVVVVRLVVVAIVVVMMLAVAVIVVRDTHARPQ